jgi:nitroimidazol reductase NimA-like FMN-containing flavoprotein (pyridoxamine 5'-phosphate oxidase superfamily)
MTPAEREAFLAGLHVGVLSIARRDRGPLTVPIWYDYEPGGEVWMITGRSSLKGRVLEDVDRISVCVQTEAAPYQYVSVEGPYTTSALEEGQLEAMAIRYLGDEMGKAYAAASSEGGDSMVVSLTPENWLTVDYGKR